MNCTWNTPTDISIAKKPTKKNIRMAGRSAEPLIAV